MLYCSMKMVWLLFAEEKKVKRPQDKWPTRRVETCHSSFLTWKRKVDSRKYTHLILYLYIYIKAYWPFSFYCTHVCTSKKGEIEHILNFRAGYSIAVCAWQLNLSAITWYLNLLCGHQPLKVVRTVCIIELHRQITFNTVQMTITAIYIYIYTYIHTCVQ